MKTLLTVGGIAAAALALALPAGAGDVGSLAVKVTVRERCVTVTPIAGGQTLDLGVLSFTTPTQPGGGTFQSFRVTNCSTDPEAMWVKGTDATSATSPATWTLQDQAVSCPTVNRYDLSTQLYDSSGKRPDLTQLATYAKPQESALPVGTFDAALGIGTPCTGSAGAGEAMTFQIVYLATD